MSAIDEYLSKLESPQRLELERIRMIVHDFVPGVTETISYGIPVFKFKDKYLIGMDAYEDHMSIFPGSYPVERLQNNLRQYKTSKGTIQFTIENPLTEKLIAEIVNLCTENIVPD